MANHYATLPLRQRIAEFIAHPHRRAAAYTLAAALAALAVWRLILMYWR
jgi:hypothetical protein